MNKRDKIRTNKTKIIAVCGKGGVGKTSISSLIVKTLQQDSRARILAIDADPAVGFSTSLGVKVRKTVDDIRKDVIDASRAGRAEDTASLLSRLDYELFDAITEVNNVAFLAIGRPETDGCYCKINDYLRHLIKKLSDQFDYVVIDGEAGIEQVNRRVMEKVTHLLLVSDASRKGLDVIRTIHQVAAKVVPFDQAGALINRIKTDEEKALVDLQDVPLLGWMLEDDKIRNYDIRGQSLLDLPDGPSVRSVKKILADFTVTTDTQVDV